MHCGAIRRSKNFARTRRDSAELSVISYQLLGDETTRQQDRSTFDVRFGMSSAARPGDFTGLTLDSKGIGDETIKPVDESVEQWLSLSIQMKRELKPEEHEEIVKAIAAGDRVKATSLYLSATEGDLTTAQNFIKTLILEKQAAQSQESARERD
jgi:hypothetical protein